VVFRITCYPGQLSSLVSASYVDGDLFNKWQIIKKIGLMLSVHFVYFCPSQDILSRYIEDATLLSVNNKCYIWCLYIWDNC